MIPLWLDPTPAVRAFVGSFANAPVREPFIKQRKQLRAGVPFAVAAEGYNAARKQTVIDELKETGETPRDRRLRKMREWHIRNNIKKLEAKQHASGSNTLRVGVKGEESSSPSVKP